MELKINPSLKRNFPLSYVIKQDERGARVQGAERGRADASSEGR